MEGWWLFAGTGFRRRGAEGEPTGGRLEGKGAELDHSPGARAVKLSLDLSEPCTGRLGDLTERQSNDQLPLLRSMTFCYPAPRDRGPAGVALMGGAQGHVLVAVECDKGGGAIWRVPMKQVDPPGKLHLPGWVDWMSSGVDRSQKCGQFRLVIRVLRKGGEALQAVSLFSTPAFEPAEGGCIHIRNDQGGGVGASDLLKAVPM